MRWPPSVCCERAAGAARSEAGLMQIDTDCGLDLADGENASRRLQLSVAQSCLILQSLVELRQTIRALTLIKHLPPATYGRVSQRMAAIRK